ncbi:glycosyltransferase family 1 protein [Desulfopila sp. IMCC35008]|uniref:glycosyltransferase family 4 protein n=1 Tax=Desulfopila sp. IMCC35008 TaxID=2653858 RepID=UPI0013D0A505|nr:glycosyltransferase family 1 protein [Desulfopila sp. IMCC35008]
MRLGVNTLFMVPGDVGGTETYLRETLLASLKAYPDVEFIFFTNNENDELLQSLCSGYENVDFHCLNFNAANRPTRIILEQIKLPFVARKYNLDLLWSPGYTAPFFAFSPQAVTVCDLQYKSYPEDMTWLERATLDFLVRGACRRCDIVLAISEFSRQEIINYGFADPGKVHTVLLGVDKTFGEHYQENEKEQTLKKLLPDSQPFILCVAHTYPHKKVHVLIEAFQRVMDAIPHNLVVVGRARRGEELVLKSAQKLADSDRLIRFQDGLPYKDLQILYQAADIFVLPSAYEGFGLPVIEAMMAGTPVITTREASLKEVAGGNGLLVDGISADDIAKQILKFKNYSYQEKTEMIENAKRWAETFTWQRSAHDMFDAFSQHLGK